VVDVKLAQDIVCPWCFIGERRLRKALATLDNKQFDVKITIAPFLLSPDAPTPGESRRKLIMAKYKLSEDEVKKNAENTRQKGKEQADINFDDGTGPAGNTINAHRLLLWTQAQSPEKAVALLDALHSQLFEKSQDPSLKATLLAAAKEVGLDETKAGAFLDSATASPTADEVRTLAAAAKARGVKTVPNIIINGTMAADGSQTDFGALFKQIGLTK